MTATWPRRPTARCAWPAGAWKRRRRFSAPEVALSLHTSSPRAAAESARPEAAAFKVWINGTLYDKQNAKISVYDHGLLYGDGVFEGLRSYGGKVFRLKQHLDRLCNSAKTIWLEIPISRDEMAKAVNDTLAANKIQDGY